MRRVVSLVCLTVLATVAVAATPRVARAAPKPSVAILGLELKDDGTGIDERSANIARLLTEALRKRAKVPNGPYALSPGSDRELVDVMLLGGCDSSTDTKCMAKLGAAPDLAADFLIYGKLEKQAKDFQVSLTLLDVGKGTIVRRLSDIIPSHDTGDVALDRWGKSLYARLAGVSNKGSISITANVDTGQVFIEGQPKSNLVKGTARVSGLEEGKVKLRVESGGMVDEQVVTINGGETTEVTVKLDKGGGDHGGGDGTGLGAGPGGTGGTGDINISREGNVSAGRPGGVWRKVFWGSAIAAGVAGGVWAFSFTQYSDTFQGKLEGPYSSKDCGDNPSDASSDFRSRCDALKRSWIVGPVTIGAVALAGVAFYMGYVRPPDVDEGSARGTASRRHKKRVPVSVTPVISPDGGGATVRFDW